MEVVLLITDTSLLPAPSTSSRPISRCSHLLGFLPTPYFRNLQPKKMQRTQKEFCQCLFPTQSTLSFLCQKMFHTIQLLPIYCCQWVNKSGSIFVSYSSMPLFDTLSACNQLHVAFIFFGSFS